MGKAFNASEFRSSFKGHNPASTSYFMVRLALPKAFNSATKGGAYIENFSNRAVACDLPTVEIDTTVRAYNGPMRQIPTGHIHPTSIVEFIEGEDGMIREFFDKWLNYIYDVKNGYRVPFYDDIISEKMSIDVYARNGELISIYDFHDVFPRSISPTQMHWTPSGNPMTVPVEFSYHKWTRSNVGG